jgi:cell division protein FtsL
MVTKQSATAELDKRISTHEAICAERYQSILFRLTRMERFILSAMVVLIMSMASVIWISLAK